MKLKKLFAKKQSKASSLEVVDNISLTRNEVEEILESKGLKFDISSISENEIIIGYTIDTSDPQEPRFIVNHKTRNR